MVADNGHLVGVELWTVVAADAEGCGVDVEACLP